MKIEAIEWYEEADKRQVERMNKLNLETFNDILFGALKDQSVEGQIKLLKAELNMIGDMLF